MKGLELILGEKYHDFMETNFESEHCRIERNDENYYNFLLSKEKIEAYLADTPLTYPDVRLVKNASPIAQSEYVVGNIIQKKLLFEQFLNGATIAFSGLHKSITSLKELVLDLETETGHRFQTNVYLTPPNSQGFEIHYDSHDVLVIQVGGEKTWKIYDERPILLPHHDQKFNEGEFQHGKCIDEFTLKQGDSLYIPRGAWHEARSTSEYSMHITVGFMGTAWSDLLRSFIKHESDLNVELRKYVPFDQVKGKDKVTMVEEIKKKLKDLIDNGHFEAFIEEKTVKEIASSQKPIVGNFIDHSYQISELTEDSVLAKTSDLSFFMKESDDSLIFIMGGEEFKLPSFTSEVLTYISESNSQFKIKDLPEIMDMEGTINLTISLISKGVLKIIEK